jgi:hypothetical protein
MAQVNDRTKNRDVRQQTFGINFSIASYCGLSKDGMQTTCRVWHGPRQNSLALNLFQVKQGNKNLK